MPHRPGHKKKKTRAETGIDKPRRSNLDPDAQRRFENRREFVASGAAEREERKQDRHRLLLSVRDKIARTNNLIERGLLAPGTAPNFTADQQKLFDDLRKAKEVQEGLELNQEKTVEQPGQTTEQTTEQPTDQFLEGAESVTGDPSQLTQLQGVDEFGNPIQSGINTREMNRQLANDEIQALGIGLLGGIPRFGSVSSIRGARNIGGTPSRITRTAETNTNSLTTQRSIIGKGGKSQVDLLFKKLGGRASDASRWEVNGKSKAITRRWLVSAGFSYFAATQIMDALGSYPFAGFVNEEALQQLSLAANSALDAGNYEEAERINQEWKEMLDPPLWNRILSAIPIANVIASLKGFRRASSAAQETYESNLERAREGAPTDFEIQQANAEQRRREELGLTEQV